MPTPVGAPQSILEERRSELERIGAGAGQLFRYTVRISLKKAGGATVDVNFPVAFQDKPALSSGGELAANEVLEEGNFPTCSVMVYRWKTKVRGGKTYYTGATLVCVADGPRDMKYTLHWSAEGRALQNPV